MRSHFLLSLALGVSISLVVGCGSSDQVPLAKIRGQVTVEGQPIKEGAIIFEVTGARSARGKIVDGAITEVTTYEPGDGVPLGTAQVAVHATEMASPAEPQTPQTPDVANKPSAGYMGAGAVSLIPARYNNLATSELNCEIVNGENEVNFDLKKS